MLIFENTRISTLFCLAVLFLLIQIAVSPISVRADADTIHLKNGGFVTGKIMEVIPDQYATIRLADETVRKIEWAEIERVEMAPEQPPKPPQVQAEKPQPEATPPAAVEPITPLPVVRYEERKSSGIPGMYIPGFIVLGVSWVLTIAICPAVSRANGPDDDYDSDWSEEPQDIDILASLIPVIGPWIGLVSDESRVPVELWILSGATQGIGIALAIAGLSLERTQRIPIYASTKTDGIKAAYLTPAVLGSGTAGLSLKLIHY